MAFLDEVGVVSLGSNLPGEYNSSLELLEAAVPRFPEFGFRLVQISPWWQSPAWPNPTDPDYLNGIVLVETSYAPRAALEALLRLEHAFGRARTSLNAPRTLDLDLIALGRAVICEEGLILPHPRAHERGFVMGPLAQIAPQWTHPVLGRSAQDLAQTVSVGINAKPLARL
jgi:2-amino-4-hydroxy-6-hydroxymethyldihydropteridine diphosphokinase